MKPLFALAIILLFCRSLSQTSGCLVFVPGSPKCSVCTNNLQLDDQGNCALYTPIQGCNVYNSSGKGGCVSCGAGYMLSTGVCLALLPNCAVSNDINTCTQCSNGYVLVRYSHCYSSAVTNCSLGSLPRSVSGVNFCQTYSIFNCKNPYPDNSYCQACNDGFTLINGICFSVQSTIPCPNAACNCNGYYFNNNCYNIKLSNCLRTADGVYCDLCGDTYYSATGVCQQYTKPNDMNCNLMNGSRCAACNLNYVLNSDFICVRNFQLCPNTCASCPYNGFSLYQGNCLFSDPLCLVYNFTQQLCQLCQEGFLQDPRTLVCVKEVTCLTRNANNICTSCFTGYQLNLQTMQCVQLPPNCLTMDLTSGFCTACSPLATLAPSGCIFPSSNCLTYNYNGLCQTCSSGFVQVVRACLPFASNCQTYGPDQSTCSVCLQGYHSSAGQCYLNLDGCSTYSQMSQCSQCSNGYQLVNSVCYFSDVNCLAQDPNGLCLGCSSGYLPSKGRCVYYDPYCLSYDPSTLTCTQTVNGFSLGSFSLQQQLAYLNFVLQASSANQAAASADYIGGAGQGSYSKNGIIYWLPYAGLSSASVSRYSINGNVLACQSGYTLIQGQCVISTNSCSNYNQYGTCQVCNPGYDLIFNNSCVLRSPATCQTQSGGICLVGASGYVVINGSAYYAGNNINQANAQGMVTAAKSGYFVWSANNIAWPLDANCQAQTAPGTCNTCSFAFTLTNGRCLLAKNNCAAYSTLGLCMGCNSGYQLWTGECRPSSYLSLDQATGMSLVCSPGFYLSLGVCLPAAVNFCQIYSGSRCLYCSAGYYLTSSGLCSKMISFCSSADPQTGRCLTCVTNYTFYNEQCIPRINNCDVYASTLTSCASCITSYYPIFGGSQCGYLGVFCLALTDTANCSSCRPGYNLIIQSNTKICVRPITNCLWYDNRAANCLTCNTGYVLQYNACKSIRCYTFNVPLGQCTACYPPFTLNNNTCYDPNCLTAVGQVCLSCLPRFYLSNGLCIAITDPNCLNAVSSGCIQCLPGYATNSNGLCVSIDNLYNGCATQTYPCPACQTGYVLNGSLCWARKCSAYKANRDCLSCINYYQFQSTNRFCILYTCTSPACYLIDTAPDGFYYDANNNLAISNCAAYAPNAACTTCQNYRYPNPAVLYNLCYPYNCNSTVIFNCTGKCVTSFVNFQNTGACVADNCVSYDTTGRCVTCNNAYVLNNGICQLLQILNCTTIDYTAAKCTQCVLGYDLYNGLCRVSNCSVFTPNGLGCTTCLNGYFLISGLCQVGKCSSLFGITCQQCLLGYYLSNGLCYASNCQAYDPAAIVCQQCSTNYELIQGVGICKPSNCANYDNNLNCTTCNSGYLLANGVCIIGDPNCIKWDSNNNCLSCLSPAFLPISNKCIPRVPGCSNYSATGCTDCLPQYSWTNGLCTAKYCTSSSTPDICLTCRPQFQLQPDGSCTPLYCATFDRNQWACNNCQPRYQLVLGVCFTYNCTNYSVNNFNCLNCAAGFTLLQNTCIFSNCLNSTLLACPACLPNFNLINGVCQAPQDNCAQYDFQQFVCKQCNTGYRLSSSGLCQSTFVDPYCLAFNTNAQCSQCFPNFVYNPNSQQCENSFCIKFSSSTPTQGRTCTGCLPGFALDPSNRYCISIYCLNYVLTTGYCLGCVPGASLNSNVCYAKNCQNYSLLYPPSPVCQTCFNGYLMNTNSLCPPANCASYAQDLSCSSCSNGYALNSSGLCVTTSCPAGFVFQNFVCVAANCRTYNATTNQCIQCLPGYVQQKQSCIAQSCIRYDTQYNCLACAPGFNLTSVNGQPICVLSVTPVCPSGFYFTQNSCNLIPITNCTYSDPLGKTCYACLPGYLLYNNLCYYLNGCIAPSFISGCNNCLPGYTLNGFLCIYLNCATLYPNNTCQTCPNTYTLSNGRCTRTIYMCSNTDSNGNCIQCVTGFSLSNGYCIATGCVQYDPATYVCLACGPAYTLNPNKQTCDTRPVLPNCFNSLNASFCQQCNNGYVQLSGTCFLQINWCLAYINATGLCSQCTVGYYVSSNGQCLGLPSNCLQANPSGQCLSCAVGYRVFNFQCFPNIPNCQSFSPSSGLCLTCATNYYLTAQGQCLSLPAYCTAANTSGACTACLPGYSVAGTLCTATINFCQIYNQNNPVYCFQCVPGYYLNNGYSCTLLPPNCLNANSLGVCLSCAPNFSLVGSICVAPVDFCITYVQIGNNQTRCSQCSTGYVLTNTFTCSQLPPYCASGSAGVCTACLSSYILYQGFCVSFVPNCVAWNNVSLQCSGCQSGYYLALNGNNYLCTSLPQYCLQADTAGNCLTCLPNYIVYNYQCVDSSSILNCRVYNLTSMICTQCFQNFTLNANNRCIPNNCQVPNNQGTCSQCYPGYLLIGNNLCAANIANCSNYNNVTGACAQCVPGCSLANNGWACTPNNPYCTSYSPQGQCQTCAPGYYLSQTYLCTQLPTGCSAIAPNLLCATCLPQYTLVSGYCVSSINFCSVYNLQGCTVCISGYYLMNNLCNPFPQYCLSYDTGLNHCVACITGYTLNPNTYLCTLAQLNCANYNPQGQCIYCITRYYLQNGNCRPYPIYCVNVDCLGNCISCAFGSVLQNGACVPGPNRNMNCLTFDANNNLCLACMTGYSFCPSTGVCLLNDPACTALAPNGACSACLTNYQLYNGNCLLYPPGMTILPNGAISCLSGYSLSIISCLRTPNTLTPLSSMQNACQFAFSSNNNTQPPFIGTNNYWTPSATRLNQYLSVVISNGKPQIVFQITTKGTQQGWVTGYLIQFRNLPTSPFICWNGCNLVNANTDGTSTSTLSLAQPIIATEIRIYPVSWTGNYALQIDIGILPVS